MRNIINTTVIAAATLFVSACFNLDEKAFNRIEKDNFYQNENSVKGAIASVYFPDSGGV